MAQLLSNAVARCIYNIVAVPEPVQAYIGLLICTVVAHVSFDCEPSAII